MALSDFNTPARYAGQRYGANYAPAYPGEHVTLFGSLAEAEAVLREDPHACAGDSILLWSVSVHDSRAEAVSATLSDAAHADRIVILGALGGTRVERV